MSGGKFEAQVQKFVKTTKEKADAHVRKIALAVFSNVVASSPVDTGRFRGNWQIGIGVRPTEQLDRLSHAGGEAGKLRNVKMGATLFITNTLPYAMALEFGHSKQAPNGIVRLVMANIDAIVKDIE